MPSYLLICMFVFAFTQTEVYSRPSNSDSSMIEENVESTENTNKEQRSISYPIDTEGDPDINKTRDIVEKIKLINNNLRKPQRTKINTNEYSKEDYVIDKELLEKIKQLIASNKLNTEKKARDIPESNYINDDHSSREMNSKQFKLNTNAYNTLPVHVTAVTYLNVPLLIVPTNNEMIGSYIMNNNLQSRQDQSSFPGLSSLPFLSSQNFQWPWPFAHLFPVLIKDPFVAVTQGGGWNNFFEYGQSSDVCNRKHKAITENEDAEENFGESFIQQLENLITENNIKHNNDDSYRDARAVIKYNITDSTPHQQRSENANQTKTIYTKKPVATKKPVKLFPQFQSEPTNDVKNEDSGDLRFPFSDFTLFGNRKPIAPSPGFFINKLRVRKGGVAIAGPGGVATAGNGGTAIVGAGGLAYTKPGGLAVAGPEARVVALPSESDFSSVLSLLQKKNGTYIESSKSIREGRLVATGPAIYYHPKEQTFFGPVRRLLENQENQPDVLKYDGRKFVSWLSESPNFVFQINPIAHAFSGNGGISISNPKSQVILRPGDKAIIFNDPQATAIAGPGGIAYAESELDVLEYNIQ